MKNPIQYLFQIIIRGFIVSLILVIVFFSLEFIFGRMFSLDIKLVQEIGYYFLYGVVLTAVNSLFFNYLNTNVNWTNKQKYRIIIGTTGCIIITMITIFLLRILQNVVFEGKTLQDFLEGEHFSFYYVSLLITMVVTLFYHTIYFYKQSQENKVKEQKIIASNASAQFESLKNQIDPHFLFNSLNVLSSLIEENQDSAQKFTTSLSKIYRYVLEQKDKELVTVEEELNFAKTYMNLLKMRFENSISYSLPDLNLHSELAMGKVVPLALQLLLENTIKHNVVSEQKPLHIAIEIKNNELIISNNLQKKEVLSDRKGVGLQNIVDRYAMLTDRNVLVTEKNDNFSVSIPILTKQVIATVEEPIYQDEAMVKVQERVKELKEFYGNLTSYCIVIPLLIIINLSTSNYQWFWYPLIGWGFGVVMHAFGTFGWGKNWEEKKIKDIIQKNKISNQSNTWQ